MLDFITEPVLVATTSWGPALYDIPGSWGGCLTAGVGTDDFNGGSAFGAGVLGKDNAKKNSLISF